MLASGSTDCQPNHHGLMELFDCLCCHHSFFINSLLEKKISNRVNLDDPCLKRINNMRRVDSDL